eukprot:1179913-Prorocentrum_minimum.AAC.1
MATMDAEKDTGVTSIVLPRITTQLTAEGSWPLKEMYALESTHGGLEELKKLLAAAHARGMTAIAQVTFTSSDWSIVRIYPHVLRPIGPL